MPRLNRVEIVASTAAAGAVVPAIVVAEGIGLAEDMVGWRSPGFIPGLAEQKRRRHQVASNRARRTKGRG
jgi:hypothetical protein